MQPADAQEALFVLVLQGLVALVGVSVLVYGVIRGVQLARAADEDEPTEKTLPRLPLFGCFALVMLCVLAVFVYVIVKYIL